MLTKIALPSVGTRANGGSRNIGRDVGAGSSAAMCVLGCGAVWAVGADAERSAAAQIAAIAAARRRNRLWTRMTTPLRPGFGWRRGVYSHSDAAFRSGNAG